MRPTSEIREANNFGIAKFVKLNSLGGTMNEKIKKEYDRLKALFIGVAENKSELIDELLKKAAFLKVQLDKLEEEIEEYGAVIYNKSHTVSKETQTYKTFLSSLGTYQAIIKTLNGILGTSVEDEDDEFDEFIKKAKGV